MKYEVRIKFQTGDEELGDRIVNCIQDDYATTWSRLKLHGKVVAEGEKVLKENETLVDII